MMAKPVILASAWVWACGHCKKENIERDITEGSYDRVPDTVTCSSCGKASQSELPEEE